jgi:hypothetical protein
VAGKKSLDRPDHGPHWSELNGPNRYGIIFLLVTENSPVVAAGNGTAAGLGEEGTGDDGALQSGGGASPPPPRPGGSLRETLEHRERAGVLELGLLRRAQTGEQLARR